ncbi:xanthine dehydrogenase family protein subunit M [Mesorhizobium sp. KR1-2]|uniref:FAD binding domain-containing protein n=1 Tax=Mesorhizobium sp. KR1-2 TaxID=3156609 RepID=UPI0032B44F0B
MHRYAKPTALEEALTLLGRDDDWLLLAGGTDVYPALGDRPLQRNVLDLNGLAELRGISETATHLVIGARTTWAEIARHDLPPAFGALQAAAREVGSIQIQNRATIAGNLCNASPAADGVPALLVLNAEVDLRALGSTRHLPLSDFILGNRRTVRQPDELVTAIRVPKRAVAGASAFQKLGSRRYLVISIVMAAARIAVEHGIVTQAAVAVGACSAVAKRLHNLEAGLRGLPVGPTLAEVVAEAAFNELAPIDDVRGSADYRRLAAREIVARAVLATIDPTNARAAAA